jgi:hypothetical protein
MKVFQLRGFEMDNIHGPAVLAESSFLPKAADDVGGCAPSNVPPASSSSAALSVRDGLRAKLDSAKSALGELDADRLALAFDAHTSGAEAKAKLTSLNKKRLMLISDIETLEVAVLEASRRVDDAARAEELAVDAEKASQVLSCKVP